MTDLTLVLVHRGPEYARDFEEIREKILAIDPAIAVHVCDRKGFTAVHAAAWQRPAFTVSLTQAPLTVPRGAMVKPEQIDKIIQLRTAAAAGVSVPGALPFRFGMWLDPVIFGEHVVIKPRDVQLMSSGEGIHLFRRQRLQSIGPDYFPPEHPIFRDRVGYMVQRYVDQGDHPTYNRILTFLGRPIYKASGRRSDPRPPLSSPDVVLEAANITIQGGTKERQWGVDQDVEALACKAAAAFPHLPLLAIDIIREERTGRPFFLECNPGGNTWHFSSNQSGGLKIRMAIGEVEKHGRAKALELGRARMIANTGAFGIVAEALAAETRARAR